METSSSVNLAIKWDMFLFNVHSSYTGKTGNLAIILSGYFPTPIYVVFKSIAFVLLVFKRFTADIISGGCDLLKCYFGWPLCFLVYVPTDRLFADSIHPAASLKFNYYILFAWMQ